MSDQQPPPRLSNGEHVLVAIVKDTTQPAGFRIVGDPNISARQVLALLGGLTDDLLITCAAGAALAQLKTERDKSPIVIPNLKLA
jgi:hypothetical protein